MNENNYEDEFVKIYGGFHGDPRDMSLSPQIPRMVVPLSEAIPLMDVYLEHYTELDDESDKEHIFFQVYSCRDNFHLFSYDCRGIISDHRNEERPKNRKQVWYVGVVEGEEPKRVLFGDRIYAEWADREMEKDFAKLSENELVCKIMRITPEELAWENFRFDVYQDEHRALYLYSYKNGERYIRPLTEEEVKNKEWWEDNCKPVLLKMMNDDRNPSKVHAEYVINEKRVERSILLRMEEVKRAKEKEAAFGIGLYPEKIFFETYDMESGVLLKTYRIEDDKVTEDIAGSRDSLPFMKNV